MNNNKINESENSPPNDDTSTEPNITDVEKKDAIKKVKDIFSLYGHPNKVPYQELKQSLTGKQINYLLEEGIVFCDSEKKWAFKMGG